jgi:hypothetical protein
MYVTVSCIEKDSYKIMILRDHMLEYDCDICLR